MLCGRPVLLTMSRSDLLQQIKSVKPSAVAVAEIEAQRVVSDALEAKHLNVGKVLLFAPTVLVAKDIFLAARLGAGRSSAQFWSAEIRLSAVVPNDGHFTADELNILRRFHVAGDGEREGVNSLCQLPKIIQPWSCAAIIGESPGHCF